MKIEVKWSSSIRRIIPPNIYPCTISFTNPPDQLYSVILYFPQQVRTWAELELLVVKDLVIPDGVFYITEGGRVVAEAQRYVE